MPPKQATLGKFFGRPTAVDGKKQQSTLSFNGRGSKKVEQAVNGEDDDVKGVVAKEGGEENGGGDGDVEMVSSRQKIADLADHANRLKDVKDPSVATHEKIEPAREKASAKHSPSKRTKSVVTTKVKNEDNKGDEEDEEDEEPVRKRSKRNGKVAKSTPTKEETGVKTAARDQKPTVVVLTDDVVSKPRKKKSEASNVPPPIKPVAVVQVAKTEDMEVVDDVENEEEDEDDEDEKPELAAKAREKVQSTLQSHGKDPYPDWKPGEPVPYAALCTTFSLVEMTTKRLIISAHCSLFLRQVLRLTPNDLLPTVQLMANKLAADYAGIELGIGESLIMKAIGESTGRSLATIKADQNEIGDLGLVAAKSRSNQPTMFRPKPLTVRGVLDGLMNIAIVQGNGAQQRKVDGIKKLLSSADAANAGQGSKGVDITEDKGGASEAKYIVRFLEGKPRLGLAEKTVIVAVAHAFVIHETEAGGGKLPSTEQLAKGEAILKTVYSELPNYEVIIPAMVKHGIFNLRDNCKLQPGIPLKPMLAKPTKSITEVLDRFEGKTFTCEYKYDGERAQIHYVAKDSPQQYAGSTPGSKNASDGLSAIFSRNSEDLSKKYPDILAKLHTWIKPETKSFVLDCETVAWDVVEKKVLPFQQLMTRKRKDVKVEDVKVKVCVFAFDMLFHNGEAIVEKTLRERRQILHQAFEEAEGEFRFAQAGDTSDLDEIQSLLDESVKASCEGLMVKMLDTGESGYEPSKRSRNWLKVKKDYLAGIGDSLDLVVLGAYFGKGKRTSVYGAFLLGCYSSSKDSYESVCNIGTGFSEAVLEELHAELSANTIDRAKPFYLHSSVPKDQPDVWFEPRFVWEVKAADLTLSPRYKAGADALADGSGRGISLRFPRFVKRRDDKKVDEATESRMVVEMYRRQESVAKQKGPAADDDFEY